MTNPIVDPLVEVVDTSPTSELVRVEATVEGAVTVALERPVARNASDDELVSALEEALRTIAGAEGVRVVFLRGAEEAFSTGVDVDAMGRAAERAEGENREDALALARMLKQLWDLPQLTVALVEGAAFGVGGAIAVACDLAVATAEARFGFPEARLGLSPAVVAPYVIQAIGPRQARALFATGRVIDAAQAERLGLVTEVVADAAALHAAHEGIVREAMACAPGAVAEAKRLAADVFAREIDHDLLEFSAHRAAAAQSSEEGREGVRAVLERRPPRWAVEDGAAG